MVGRGLLFAVCRVSSRLNENKENRGVKQKKKNRKNLPLYLPCGSLELSVWKKSGDDSIITMTGKKQILKAR